MIINKYLIIFFIIFLIILSLLLLNYLFKDKNNYTESFSGKESDRDISPLNNKIQSGGDAKDTEVTSRINIMKESNNLIINGNFENGRDSPNHITQSGYNKIILRKNPGQSSYVLEQKKSENLTYYEFVCENDKNSKYNLYFWLSVNNSPIEEIDFNKLINIKFQNEDFSNYIPRLNYNIVQKIVLSNDDEQTWYLIKYDFISGNNTKNKMQIYLNYSTNLQYETYYFTGLALYKVLIDAENFIFNNKLISYADGYNYESNTQTWHDLSGNGNDLFWQTIPLVDYTIGSLDILRTKLVGFPANKLSNKNFSILFCLNKNFENIASDNSVNEKNSVSEFYLLSIPGNDRYSFEIVLKDNYLYLIVDKNEYKSKHEIILYNKSLLAITYTGETINIYHDGVNILSQKIKKLYFSPDNLLINRNKNLNLNFFSLLFYNRVVNKKELDQIREYFITNQDKNFNAPDINNYQMNNNAQYTVINSDNLLFKPYNKKENNNNIQDSSFIDTFDNQNNKLKGDKDKCITDCTTICEKFSDKFECMKNCKNILQSCKNYCDDVINKDSVLCKFNSNTDSESDSDKKYTNDCPKVYKKDGKYIVYIAPNSSYAKALKYSGEKSYGTNLDKARYTYNINFPKCPIPPELMPGEGKNYTESCPYIINELNPCYTSSCAGVNWNVKNHTDLNLNKNCKKSVSNYCQINYNLDDNCVCWNPKYKDDKKCIEFRRYFENPNDYCSPNQFKIEEHPDFNKYIKKDNIPCWGCNINM